MEKGTGQVRMSIIPNVDYSCADPVQEIVKLRDSKFDFIVSHLPVGAKLILPAYPEKTYKELAYHI